MSDNLKPEAYELGHISGASAAPIKDGGAYESLGIIESAMEEVSLEAEAGGVEGNEKASDGEAAASSADGEEKKKDGSSDETLNGAAAAAGGDDVYAKPSYPMNKLCQCDRCKYSKKPKYIPKHALLVPITFTSDETMELLSSSSEDEDDEKEIFV